MYFKAEIDPTSSYLILTDATSRGLYVLQIVEASGEIEKTENEKKSLEVEHSNNVSSAQPETETSVYIKSIAEFALSSPILSFGIIDASVRKYKCAYNDHYLLDELDDYDEDSLNRYCVVIHMYLVQPKSVQECHVLYQPTVPATASLGSSLSVLSDAVKPENILGGNNNYSSPKEKESLDDASSTLQATQQLLDAIINKSPASGKSDSKPSQSANTSGKTASSVSLMTPDSFHSHGNYLAKAIHFQI